MRKAARSLLLGAILVLVLVTPAADARQKGRKTASKTKSAPKKADGGRFDKPATKKKDSVPATKKTDSVPQPMPQPGSKKILRMLKEGEDIVGELYATESSHVPTILSTLERGVRQYENTLKAYKAEAPQNVDEIGHMYSDPGPKIIQMLARTYDQLTTYSWHAQVQLGQPDPPEPWTDVRCSVSLLLKHHFHSQPGRTRHSY